MEFKTEELRLRVTPTTKSSVVALAAKLGISISSLVILALSEQFGERLADALLESKKKNEDAQLPL